LAGIKSGFKPLPPTQSIFFYILLNSPQKVTPRSC
jgi:hypothetical protein